MNNELDLMILKALVTNKKHALDFVSECDPKLFSTEVWNFANLAVGYIRTYKELPTQRVMVEKLAKGNNEKLIEHVRKVWDQLDRFNYNVCEYKHDLEKIKRRYAEKQITSIREVLAKQEIGSMDLSKSVGEMQKTLQSIKALNQVKAYERKTLKEAVPIFREEYNAKMEDPHFDQGIKTGYSYFDNVTDGLRPGELVLIGGESGAGKALPLDTIIPTPTGMKLMKNIHKNDEIFGIDGKVYKVIAEGEVINAPGWKFTFDDGSTIVSHENHEWLTTSNAERQALFKGSDYFRKLRREKRNKNSKEYLVGKNTKIPNNGSVKTTLEIVNSLFLKNGKTNHAIPICEALELPHKELKIHPYVLGSWLGDGSSREGTITSMDTEIIEKINEFGYGCKSIKDYPKSKAKNYRFINLQKELRHLGLLKNKHIPESYLYSSKEQRIDLLKGLMDTDGFVSKTGQIEFTNTNVKIIEGLSFLIRSLGEKCTITEGLSKLNGKIIGPKWTIRFNPLFKCFYLKRKLDRQKNNKKYKQLRYIIKAEKIENVDMKCIQVSSPDHLYLATENFIPTHNSMLLMNMAIQLWMQNNTIDMVDNFSAGQDVLYFSLEMPFKPCLNRVLARLSGNPSKLIRNAKLNAEEAFKLKRGLKFINNYPHQFEIIDIPRGATIESLELIYEEAKANYDPKIIVIDYMGLMDFEGPELDDWLKLGKIAEKIHEFARVHNLTVLSAVQLNRGKSNKEEDRVGMHRIGRSALIMTNANIAVQIETRSNEKDHPDMNYHLIKNRDGQLGKGSLIKNLSHGTLIDNKIEEDSTTFEMRDPDDISEKLDALD